MSTSVEPWQPILDKMVKAQAGYPGPAWTWDGRLKCVSSTFPSEMIASVRQAFAELFPHEWTVESFASAPEPARVRCGNLRAGQLLLTGDEVATLVPFAMWWPWGDGKMVSLRVGVANSERTKELYPLVRASFGIMIPSAPEPA